jgi:acetylornithine/N-succinyldiaminopimelate aminotransferase
MIDATAPVSQTATWSHRWQTAMMPNYGRPPVLIVRGSGSRVWDDTGNEYLDLIAGIAVNALGHAHPAIINAVTQQLSTLGHTSNLVATLPGIELAERLIEMAGVEGRVFFCNSGAEANEAAFKLTRLTGRQQVIVAHGSFHGRTMGALALTAQPAKQDPFRPLPGDVIGVPFGDAEALRSAISSTTAAVFLEPIQGEGGVLVPPDGYLLAARRACDDVGAMLVLDEVQTGVGRTGTWLGFQHEAVIPDVITMAKGLGGGLPIGAVVGIGAAATMFTPGSHGSTFGGNPIAASAAHAVLDVIEGDGLLARATELHDRLAADLRSRSGGRVVDVRGRGLLLAAVLGTDSAAEVEQAARSHGLLVNAVAPNAIRLAPALTICDEEVAEAMARWEQAMASLVGPDS